MKKRFFKGILYVLFICLILALPQDEAQAAKKSGSKKQSLKYVTQAPKAKGKWIRKNGKRMFRKKDGSYAKGEWLNIKGNIYLFSTKGFVRSGIIEWNGEKYYLRKEEGLKTGWAYFGGSKYYFKWNGVMVRGRFMEKGGKTYYMYSSGKMARGWVRVKGKKYYMDRSGVMQKGMRTVDGKQYYFGKNGVMTSSKWITYNGEKYYFLKSGKMAKGWLTLKGKKYYMGSDGAMRTGEQWINGEGCYFGKDGVYDPKKEVSRVDPDKPMVALTFDDGPGPYTDRLLRCLEENDALATFFLVGSSVSNYRSTVARAADMGCEIGNHTWSHPSLTGLSADGIRSQMSSTNDAIRQATGKNATLMRPPYGAYNSSVLSCVGVPAILWSIDTRDWEHRNADRTVSNVLTQVKDGDIILMHDIHKATVDAAERLIPELKRRGYQLVTVSELAKYKQKSLSAGNVYTAIR